jgi:hypothetical protein
MGPWLGLFAWIMGGISLFTLTKRYFDFHVIRVIQDIMEFYRALLHPVANFLLTPFRWILSIVSISIPQFVPDLIILYIAIGLALYRTYPEYYKDQVEIDLMVAGEIGRYYPPPSRLGTAIGFIRLAAVWPTALYSILFRRNDHILEIGRRWGSQVLILLAAFLVLFAFNAAGPSIGL